MGFDENGTDVWRSSWGNQYTSKQFYSHTYSIVEAHPVFKLVWKSGCSPRIKFFFSLVLVDRLNTKTILTRRHIGARDNGICIMCNSGTEETIDHLFFSSPFARSCWNTIHLFWDLSLPVSDMFVHGKDNNGLDFFTEAALIAAWEL